MEKPAPKKRGRKSKKQLAAEKAAKFNGTTVEKKVLKKRGRKPKGGKIVKNTNKKNKNKKISQPNIILHLKASSEDLNSNIIDTENVQSFSIQSNKNLPLQYKSLENIDNNIQTNTQKSTVDCDENSIKDIWAKLLVLKKSLHHNQLVTKRSACFWCTHFFDNPPIYIPKQKRNGMYEVYGCFCSPECSAAFLKKEQIDESTRWERYAMLNNIYGKIYNYEKNIKPAPNPYYTLEKFHGNLSISEYRQLLFDDRLLIVVDKPLTKIVPELYEENNETPFIYGNLLTSDNKKKSYRLKRKQPKSNKTQILNNNFNIGIVAK